MQVGAAAAFADTGKLVAARTGYLLLGSILIIAWLNLRSVALPCQKSWDLRVGG